MENVWLLLLIEIKQKLTYFFSLDLDLVQKVMMVASENFFWYYHIPRIIYNIDLLVESFEIFLWG